MQDTATTATIGGGNTITPPKTLKKLCFTLCNYENTEYNRIIAICELRKYKYCIGKEVAETGTPHLQGYIEFPSARTFDTCKKLLPRAHIEKARGSREENVKYCSKDGNFISTFPVPVVDQVLKEYDEVVWHDWQQDLLALYVTPPDSRHIHWYIDPLGNKGKSFLTRYMVAKYGVILCNGKKADVCHQIAKRFEDQENEKPFRMVILDLPRHSQEFTNYGLLEELKNGLVFSGKYEGGTFVFPIPHVVVMSNAEPDLNKFSMDRWKIIDL